MSAAIRCHDVWKSYRIYEHQATSLKERVVKRRNSYEEFWALREIDFDVPAGATLGIIGSNGSGKSTLLKVMARILAPNQGSVATYGTMSSLLELGTGFHPELTGKENVYLAGSLLGQKEEEVAARYDGIVDFAGISEFMDVPVKNYSSGMYARLAFAVAISVEPDILLVDEVLAVGDESFQIKCHERIAELRRQDRTVVMVSHNLEAIRSLCSEAIWIDEGTMRSQGKTSDVIADYLSEVHSGEEAIATSPGQRTGSGEVEVADVSFVNSDGAPQGAFRTGERMTVRIRYEAKQAVPEISCALLFYRADNLQLLYGQNSKEGGIPLQLAKEGVIEYTIPSLPFLKGSVLVTVGLHDELGLRVYDLRERGYSFLVFEDTRSAMEVGAVRLGGEWGVSSSVAV
jgi:lipopolysaccharide transport system ATP-binding protein